MGWVYFLVLFPSNNHNSFFRHLLFDFLAGFYYTFPFIISVSISTCSFLLPRQSYLQDNLTTKE